MTSPKEESRGRGDEAARDGTHLAPDGLARIYTGMVATLEPMMQGQTTLGDLFVAIRASGEERSLPLFEDAEVHRMLIRLGLLPKGTDAAVLGKLAEEAVRRTAETVARTPAQVSVVYRLYASGLYGVFPRPVCGSPPRCRDCGLTKLCDYYNAPPRTRPGDALPPAKRFAREGPEAVSEEEMVALLLGGPRTGKKEIETARLLLDRFGSLRVLARTGYGELCSLRGVSETQALRIALASAFHARVVAERRFGGATVRSGKDFYDLYAGLLRDLRKEVFYVVLLDQKNRILRDERVSEGTLTASLVHPREVFGPAIRESAAAVAFVHNHPSGDSSPSPEDKKLTKRLRQTAEVVGIRILDHVIVGEGSYTSFVDEDLL